ncbi:hypothetical protein pipiens_004404 [Culex pipiens pipiens]|uniref:Uncharacterized protein n=1 Tax=Culex pipiens pipiens TaxID=38569 RepID=A0ABD1CJ75_CULPP
MLKQSYREPQLDQQRPGAILHGEGTGRADGQGVVGFGEGYLIQKEVQKKEPSKVLQLGRFKLREESSGSVEGSSDPVRTRNPSRINPQRLRPG